MAAVFIPPSPHAVGNMNARRVPLADVPNATNSPLRAISAAAVAASNHNSKRPRAPTREERELAYGQAPPAKRQFVETDEAQARRDAVLRRSGQRTETPLQRKLEAARQRGQPSRPAAESESAQAQQRRYLVENVEHVREWQKHYRKAFPTYTLYLDNIPDAVKPELTRDILSLNARVEKFFSKEVTHVITTRPIPPAPATATSSSESRSPAKNAQPATINPSMLKREDDGNQQLKGKFDFDAALQRRTTSTSQLSVTHDSDTRRNVDVLTRARQMGIKIWGLEKLNRMLDTLFNTFAVETQSNGHKTRAIKPDSAQPDLSALLKQEQMHGAADRDMSVIPMDTHQFRGYYIYVHDMNEQTKPAMIRDYPKPQEKADGEWPQLRATPAGRCPFHDDQSAARRMKEQQFKAKQKLAQQKTLQAQAQVQGQVPAQRTRAATAQQAQTQRGTSTELPPLEKRVLTENNNLASRRPALTVDTKQETLAKPLEPPKTIPAKRANPDSQSALPLWGSAQASLRQLPRFAGGEPVASGIQPSNVTSAIKSQMISSTTGAPGAKAGTSKEVHQLKRKVLEKNSAPNSMPSSLLNDIRAAINQPPQPQRASRRKTREELAQIDEDGEDEADERLQQARAAAAKSKKKTAEKDLKPGYCENCHDKFEDFDKHILSSKHRKFAKDKSNWEDLDQLLEKLERV